MSGYEIAAIVLVVDAGVLVLLSFLTIWFYGPVEIVALLSGSYKNHRQCKRCVGTGSIGFSTCTLCGGRGHVLIESPKS